MDTHPATKIKHNPPKAAEGELHLHFSDYLLVSLPEVAKAGTYLGSSCARNTLVDIKPEALAKATIVEYAISYILTKLN